DSRVAPSWSSASIRTMASRSPRRAGRMLRAVTGSVSQHPGEALIAVLESEARVEVPQLRPGKPRVQVDSRAAAATGLVDPPAQQGARHSASGRADAFEQAAVRALPGQTSRDRQLRGSGDAIVVLRDDDGYVRCGEKLVERDRDRFGGAAEEARDGGGIGCPCSPDGAHSGQYAG